MRVIQERNQYYTPTVSYTRGTDLSGTLEGAGGIGGLLARSDGYSGGNWTTNNYYHADGNGNITYLVNSSQTLAAKYRYDPYGNTISLSGSLAGFNTYRFSSKEIHVNSGLYYYGYRWYDPNTQRWLNRDPLSVGVNSQLVYERRPMFPAEAEGGPNLYSLVLNNPVQLVDTDGRDWWPPSTWPIFGKPKPAPAPSPKTPRKPSNSPWCAGKECQAWAKSLNKGEPDEDACKDCFFEQFAQRQGLIGDVRNLAIIEECRRRCEKSGGLKGPKY